MTDRPEFVTNEDINKMIATRTPFRTEARSGLNNMLFPDGVLCAYTEPRKFRNTEELETGILVDEWYQDFMEAHEAGTVDYVIYSYDTVIAWHEHGADYAPGKDIGGVWKLTDTPVSATTSKHQFRVAIALRQSGEL